MNSIDNLIRRIRKSDSQNRDPITGIANPTAPSFTLRNADTWTVIAVVAEDDLTAAILDFNDLSVSVLVERSNGEPLPNGKRTARVDPVLADIGLAAK